MNETLDEQSRQSLVRYRLERADETIAEAKLLVSEGYYNATMNRLYYACFYAALALLVANGIATSSHAGVKTMLGLHFVSKGLLDKQFGRRSAVSSKSVTQATTTISSIATRRWPTNTPRKPRRSYKR